MYVLYVPIIPILYIAFLLGAFDNTSWRQFSSKVGCLQIQPFELMVQRKIHTSVYVLTSNFQMPLNRIDDKYFVLSEIVTSHISWTQLLPSFFLANV